MTGRASTEPDEIPGLSPILGSDDLSHILGSYYKDFAVFEHGNQVIHCLIIRGSIASPVPGFRAGFHSPNNQLYRSYHTSPVEHIQSMTLPGLGVKPIIIIFASLVATDFNRDIDSTVIQTFKRSPNTGTEDYRGESELHDLW